MHCSTRQTAHTHPFQISHRVLKRGLDRSAGGVGAMTILDSESRTHFEFDVPGFTTDDITIDLRDGHLIVSGEQTKTETAGNEVYTERHSRTFRRVVRLDTKLDPDTADAELKSGVLRLSLARTPDAKRHRIAIRNSTDTV